MSIGDVRAAALYYNRKRRRAQQDRTLYQPLVDAPFDLGTAAAGGALPNTLDLPARSRLAIAASEDIAAADLTVAIGARSYPVGALDADALFRLPFAEADEVVEVTSDAGCPACDVTLYVLDEWTRPSAIATGSVT